MTERASKEEGKQFAKENGLFLEASARTAQNVEQTYIRTAALMLQNIQEGVFDVSNELQPSGIKAGNGCPQGPSGSKDGAVMQRGMLKLIKTQLAFCSSVQFFIAFCHPRRSLHNLGEFLMYRSNLGDSLNWLKLWTKLFEYKVTM